MREASSLLTKQVSTQAVTEEVFATVPARVERTLVSRMLGEVWGWKIGMEVVVLVLVGFERDACHLMLGLRK